MSARKPDRPASIKSVMTPFPWYVDAGAPLVRAGELMQAHEIHHLPVKRGDALAGIVSARDVELVQNAWQGGEPARVEDAVSGDPYVVDLSSRLDRVLIDMADRNVDAALVVRGGKLAGIFTVTDVLRSYGELLQADYPESGGDDAA